MIHFCQQCWHIFTGMGDEQSIVITGILISESWVLKAGNRNNLFIVNLAFSQKFTTTSIINVEPPSALLSTRLKSYVDGTLM